MKPEIWLGNYQSSELFSQYELKYSMDKVAYSPFRDEDDDIHPDFNVRMDRKGLSVMDMVNGTPVIKVHGSLVPNFSVYHTWFAGKITSYEAIKDALLIAKEGDHKEILMDFSSGGGHVTGIDAVTALMGKLQAGGMFIHGHTDDKSFSASYWIQSQCNAVTAARMAEVGSIGTLAVVQTLANTEENLGVTFTMFKEGKFKAVGNPYEKLSDADKAYIQENLRESNDFFLNQVSSHRDISLDDVDRWAEGKTFYAAKAVKNGLVDRITTLDDLIGSGATANNTGDRRKFEMKISAEKLAQIEAGADPKAVLTTAELKQYNADLEALQEANKKAEDDAAAEKKLADDLAAEKLAKEALQGAPVNTDDPLHAAMKANGRLEARIEQLEADLKKAEESATASKATADQLLVLGQAAVEKLQTATGSPKEAKGTPVEVLKQYTDLQSKLATLFGGGGQHSEQQKTQESTTAPALASGLRQKVAQLKPRS